MKTNSSFAAVTLPLLATLSLIATTCTDHGSGPRVSDKPVELSIGLDQAAVDATLANIPNAKLAAASAKLGDRSRASRCSAETLRAHTTAPVQFPAKLQK